MKYTYKKHNYISINTGNELTEELVDINQYAIDSNQHIDNIENINLWRERFIYKENIKSILYSKPEISIDNFMKQFNLNVNENIKNVKDLYKIINYISENYAIWCKNKGYNYENTYYFCKGILGEYVWYLILKLFKTFHIPNNLNKKYENVYRFTNLCLRKDDDFDLGVDLIGEVEIDGINTHNCIFQFKFYSPTSDNFITLKLIQGVHDDGITKNFISHNAEEINTFICWLGTEKQVSKWLSRDTVLSKNVKFIDIDTLNLSSNQSEQNFKNILNKIKNIKNF